MSKDTGESVNEASRLLPNNDAENDDDVANNADDEEQQEQSFGYSELPLEQEPTESSEGESEGDKRENITAGSSASKKKKKKFKSYFSSLISGAKKSQTNTRPTLARSANNNLGGSLSQIYSSVSGSISHGLAVIKEDVEEAAEEVKDAFINELQQADDGQTYFLDTNLTRALSVLPEELGEFVEEATGIEVELGKDQLVAKPDIEQPSAEVVKEVPASLIWPFISLLTAVFAVSSNGSALALLRGVAPPLKLYWRMTATGGFLSIFALRTLLHADQLPKLNRSQWLTFAAAVVCFSCQTLLFFVALDYTAIGNAVIYANSQAVILLLGKACVGEPVVLMEGGGAMLAFIGAMLCSRDSEGSSEDGEHALLGDCLAFLSAIFGVGYLTFAKAVRPSLPVTIFMCLNMICGSFLVLIFMICSDLNISFSADPYQGLFGWMAWRPDRILVEIWIVVVCNVLGTMGFVKAMASFENIIIAVATLLEPMIASFIAFELKVGLLPGPLGWIGNALVMMGTFGVVYPSVNKGGGGGH